LRKSAIAKAVEKCERDLAQAQSDLRASIIAHIAREFKVSRLDLEYALANPEKR
jgi:hypothetical protein